MKEWYQYLLNLIQPEELFKNEKVIAVEKAIINWPYTYRLIVKENKNGKWGYLIDIYWVHWCEFEYFKLCKTREEAIEYGIKRLQTLLGRTINKGDKL